MLIVGHVFNAVLVDAKAVAVVRAVVVPVVATVAAEVTTSCCGT